MGLVVGLHFLMCYIEVYEIRTIKVPGRISRLKQRPKVILLYSDFHTNKDFHFGLGSAPFGRCPSSNCFITKNRTYLPLITDYDAIIFHIRNFGEIPKIRMPSQRYIFCLNESPHFSGVANFDYLGPGFFNWTMTYRLDSDLDFSYGKTLPRKNYYDSSTVNSTVFRLKENKAFWVASHCYPPSRRQQYVEQLQKYYPVDVFGGCGKPKKNYPCSTYGSQCKAQVGMKYKFYLAFENSFCKDYVTEKYFEALKSSAIPIVLGWGQYSKISPPNSYIDVRDFKSVKELADRLKYLSENEEEFLKYFEWKKDHTVYTPSYDKSFCSLCEKLNNINEPAKSYKNMNAWWYGTKEDPVCETETLYWRTS